MIGSPSDDSAVSLKVGGVMRIPITVLGAAVLLGTTFFAPSSVAAHDQFDQRAYRGDRRLEGRSYQTMRALAHYLDERAQHALEQASDTEHHGDRRERQFLGFIQHFARRASEFHEQMDRYTESPWDVGADIEHLIQDARNVNGRIRRAHVLEHTWDDWASVLDVLDRMQRAMSGEDVRVPSAHRRGWRDYDRDYEWYDERPRRDDREQ